MGEASSRGTKQERAKQSQEAADRDAERIAKAIAEKGHSDGLVWLVIERTSSVMELNANKTIRLTDGKMSYGPDEKGWKATISDDLPDWIKGEDEIRKLMDGHMLNAAPADGGLWYRGRIHKPTMN